MRTIALQVVILLISLTNFGLASTPGVEAASRNAKVLEHNQIVTAIKSDQKLDGVDSFYTPVISTLILRTNDTAVTHAGSQPIELACIRHPKDSLYIGLKQTMRIQAPIEKVRAIVDDINHYQQLFPGYKDIHIESRNDNTLITKWEQTVPIPFVPNVKYEMIYRLRDLPNSDRVYRYQLLKPSTLTVSDGFIYLKPLSATETLYVEYDFFNADWGAAKMMGEKKIWHDAVEGLTQSDLATKLRSEHSNWSNSKSRSESEHLLSDSQIDRCISHRIPLAATLTATAN